MNSRTLVAVILFSIGMAFSFCGLFFPAHTVGEIESMAIINPGLTIPLAVALLAWFAADILLLLEAQAEYCKNRRDPSKIAYVLLQINCLVAAVLALAPIPHWADIAARMVCAVALTYPLYFTRVMDAGTILRSMTPCIWWRQIWLGKFGTAACWLVGTELVAWGVSMLGISAALGWACLTLANLWLARWNVLDMRQGAKVGVWLAINLAFTIVTALQAAWAVWLLVH